MIEKHPNSLLTRKIPIRETSIDSEALRGNNQSDQKLKPPASQQNRVNAHDGTRLGIPPEKAIDKPTKNGADIVTPVCTNLLNIQIGFEPP